MISVKSKEKYRPEVLRDVTSDLDKLIGEEIGKVNRDRYAHIEVKKALKKLYYDKCAYCEGLIPEGYSERIDHYRPKDKIRTLQREDTGEIKYNKKGERETSKEVLNEDKTKHKGYYWLSYEWTNLVPSCERCNTKKSNLFPLQDERLRGFLMI